MNESVHKQIYKYTNIQTNIQTNIPVSNMSNKKVMRKVYLLLRPSVGN